jgi:C4-dicarboxylate-specific signal transduction histidine kinase
MTNGLVSRVGRPADAGSEANPANDDRFLFALAASEERYRNLIQHLPFALLQVDASGMAAIFDRLRADGVTDIAAYLNDHPELIGTAGKVVLVTDANRSAALLLGAASSADFIGPAGYLFTASPETLRRAMIARFERRRSHAEIMKLRTFDGRLLDVRLSLTYPTPPERVDVTLVSLEDVTDRLRTEAQLRQLQADYARAARISMLGELATSIAHEVNQPLSAIVTNAETSLRWLSRDDPNVGKVSQLTARIAESARRASGIVQRIRGMAARQPPERTLLDLNEVVDEALLFVRHDIEARSIDLSVSFGRDLPLAVADRVQLQQVIANLLLNSIQAVTEGSETDKRIDLSTSADPGSGVVFSIRDSGPGIAEENLDRVFEGFFTTKDEGIGIGLAICLSIIKAHGGTMAVSNHPEGGAHFRFSLPAVHGAWPSDR